MDQQLQENTRALAALFAIKALEIMAERAGTTPESILAIVDSDPFGATAEYFRSLMSTAAETARTHALINAPGSGVVQ